MITICSSYTVQYVGHVCVRCATSMFDMFVIIIYIYNNNTSHTDKLPYKIVGDIWLNTANVAENVTILYSLVLSTVLALRATWVLAGMEGPRTHGTLILRTIIYLLLPWCITPYDGFRYDRLPCTPPRNTYRLSVRRCIIYRVCLWLPTAK